MLVHYPFDTGRSPLIRGISQIADSSRMKTTWPPHNLVGGIYRATLIRPIKYSSTGTRYMAFVVNGILHLTRDEEVNFSKRREGNKKRI